MKPSDFDAKPMILLLGASAVALWAGDERCRSPFSPVPPLTHFPLPHFTTHTRPDPHFAGQYSVGKTSFIRYLIGRDFPGARIGPEPTTDRFNAVMSGTDDRIVPGNALAVDPSMPFQSLTKFGTEFLNKFQASMCPSPVLDKVYFVDSPGVLAGEKQKLGRAYDFVKVTEWFAQRADLILLLFDAHKLDISDEFQSAIKALKGQDDKIRVVLNKADKVTSQQLMRVYGAMMWSLGKVVNTPEVMRVYIGSFWDAPCQNPEMEKFFKMEQADLLHDLHVSHRRMPRRPRRVRLPKPGFTHTHTHILPVPPLTPSCSPTCDRRTSPATPRCARSTSS
jgi:GTP-binding protein EngB required for normal cell division